MGRAKENKKICKSKRIYRTSPNIRIINDFLESLLSESFPSLGVTVHLTSLGCPPTLCWSLDVLWVQLRFYSDPAPMCSCLQCPQLSKLVCFLLWELSMSFFIFHRQRVFLVDHVDLICSLYSWWECFGSSSLAHHLWVSIVALFPPLYVGCPLGFAPVVSLEELGLPQRGSGVEVVRLLGSQEFWQHQVLRGVGG